MTMRIRLWQLDVRAPSRELVAWCAAQLADDETAQAARTAAHVRSRFVVRRAFRRVVLGALRGEAPAAVPIRYGEYRHPTIADGPWFSTSCIETRAVVTVADDAHGVDLEAERDVPEAAEMAREWYPPALAEAIARGGPEAARRFLEGWVRLEALGKALGVGVADRLSGCAAIAPGGPAAEFAGRQWYVQPLELAGVPYAAIAAPAPAYEIVHESLPAPFAALAPRTP